MKGVYHPAAIVSAVAFYLWGYVWYGLLFGKIWAAGAGLTAAQMQAGMSPAIIIVSIIIALLWGYGTAIALSRGDNQTAGRGMSFGLFFGIVFIASFLLQANMYDGRPLSFWAVNAGYAVTGLVITGLINGGWRPRAKAG